MKRLLANAILMASGIAISSQSLALGLGELTLDSALNQPLKAEIELSDTKGFTEWDIKPSLASQVDFDRAGVERDYFLTGLRFKVENNRVVITTKEPVNEPYLNFLVEVNWPTGRVLREYTILLDPPTFAETGYQPLVMTPASTDEEEAVLSEPVKPAQVNQWDEAAEYGSYKVQPSDTLWSVALETRPNSDISPQQMMLAIQQENPEAFIGGNINRLKSHTILTIPTEDQILNINHQQAVAEVARQNNDLSAGVAQIDATGLGYSSAEASTSESGGEVRLIAPTAESSDSAASSGDAGENADKNRTVLENDLAIALENADKSSRENQELRERLESMQEQVDTLQTLLNMKNDQLSSMQTGFEDEVAEESLDEEPTELVGDEVSASDSTQLVDYNYEEDVEAEKTAEEIAAEEAEREAEEARKAEERRARIAAMIAEQEPEEEPTLLDELLANPALLAGGAAGLLLIILLLARVLKGRKKDDAAEEMGFNDPSMLHQVDSNVSTLDNFEFAGADQAESGERPAEAEDALNAHQDIQSDVLADVERSIAYGQVGEALLVLENAIAEEPDRLDYRLKQLELLSDRDDEEAFFNAEKDLKAVAGSEAVAEDVDYLRGRLTSPIEEFDMMDDDFADMLGDDFSDGLDFAAALDQSDEEVSEDTESFDLSDLDSAMEDDIPVIEDIDPLANDFDEAPTITEEETSIPAEDEGLDFDLDGFDAELTEDTASVAQEASVDDEEGLEFDATDLEIPTIEEPVIEPTAEEDDELEVEGIDFDLEATLEESAEAEVSEESSLDSSLESLESILDNVDTDTVEEGLEFDLSSVEPEAEAEVEEDDLDFELPAVEESEEEIETLQEQESAPVEEAIEEEATEVDSGEIDLDAFAASDDFDFLEGTDECATKLDLARAYIDMEDIEGAKELLQEVAQEGNDEQQAEARELIRNL